MDFIEVELCFVRKSILLSMERHGISREKVAMVGLRIQEEPFLGSAAPDSGANVFEFYWTEWQYKEHFRVLYRRLDTLEKT